MTTTNKPCRKLTFAKHFTLVGLPAPRKPRAHPLDCGYAITGRLCNCTCENEQDRLTRRIQLATKGYKESVVKTVDLNKRKITNKQKVLRRWPGLKCRYTCRWFCWAIDIPKTRLIALGRTPAQAWADAASRLT